MKFLEKDLEDIIYNSTSEALAKRGLRLIGKKKRQLRIGNYGIADLISYFRSYRICEEEPGVLYINVIELKKDAITIDTLIQCAKYVTGIKRYIQSKGYCLHNYTFHMTLIGKKVVLDDWVYLLDNFKFLNIYIYNYDIDGIRFNKQHGWRLFNEGF